MIQLEDLNEVEQKAVMIEFKNGNKPMINGEEVEIPDQIMIAYRCHQCKDMKYVRVYTQDFNEVTDTINCPCSWNGYMRINHYGAGNIALLTSVEVVKKKFTLRDFFSGANVSKSL